jgi:hypothetical protein
MNWATLSQENQLINAMQSTGRLQVVEAGRSVNNRIIRLVSAGIPPKPFTERADVFLVGSQHGNEPAGREGLLRYLADITRCGPYAQLTGASNSAVRTPDSPALTFSGDLDVRVDISGDRIGQSGDIEYIIGQHNKTGDQRSLMSLIHN